MADTKTTTFGDFINDILKKDFLAILSLLDGYKKNPNTIPESKGYEDILMQLRNSKDFLSLIQLVNSKDSLSIIKSKNTGNYGDIIYDLALSCYIKKMFGKTIELYQIAADLDNADAIYSLGFCYEKGICIRRNIQKAVELYKLAVEKGNADAMYELADCYKKGNGVPQDLKKAIELWQRASNLGNTDAMVKLGDCYRYGEGVPQDEKKAFELYEKAVKKGDTNAMVKLGDCYRYGEGVPQDEKKAFELYEKAVKKGDTNAMVKLGDCYIYGHYVVKDKEKAIELYQRAVEKGDTNAMVKLGDRYKYGHSVKQDSKKAFKLYQKAADLGDTTAMVKLGDRYRYGEGVEKDLKKAIELYQRAVEKGDTDAMVKLGDRYRYGEGVEKDMKKAIELYERAVDLGNTCAKYELCRCCLSLAVCYENGEGVEKDMKKAIELYQKAVEKDNTTAMVKLGDCYKNGEGVPKDIKKAIEFYEKAVKERDTDAMVKLGDCYKNGEGVPKDIKKAIEFYEKAVKKRDTDAMVKLGDCYKVEQNNKEAAKLYYQAACRYTNDIQKAIELYQRAANLDNADAIVELGLIMFKLANDTKIEIDKIRDDEKYKEGKIGSLFFEYSNYIQRAIELCQRASDLSNTTAMVKLSDCYKVEQNKEKAAKLFEKFADCYKNGEGIKKDMEKAIELYEKAADMGNTDAMVKLGLIMFKLANDTKIEIDKIRDDEKYKEGKIGSLFFEYSNYIQRAIELCQRASDLSNTTAMVKLGDCYKNGDGVQKNTKTAGKYYCKAADYYKNGKGIKKDMEKAIKLYEKAANLDNRDAMYEVAVCYLKGKGVAVDKKKAFEFFQEFFKKSETKKYNENDIEHVIELTLLSFDNFRKQTKNNIEQLDKYIKSIKNFFKENKEEFGYFPTDFTLETKIDGLDFGLTIVKKSKPNDKKYFLKIYPYSKKTYKDKLTEIEIFKLLDPENSMNVFDLYVDKANDCIIFCSEQALTGKILPFPKFDFEKIKTELEQPKTEEEQKEKKEENTETREIVLEEEQLKTLLEKNQDFKNLCQFFKIITYSVLLNLGDVRYSNVLMALEKQNDNKDIRVKLIDFLACYIGSCNKTNYNFKERKKFLGNFLNLFFYVNKNIYPLNCANVQYSREKLGQIKYFIKENPEISKILEKKVLEYIEEVFTKVENLSQETKKLSSQKPADQVSEPTTAVSSTTPPLPTQSSCDDTTKLSETPEQSKKDLRTLLEVRVEILKQFCERYQYIQEQLRKCSQSKTTNKPTEEVKPLPKAEQQLPEIPNASELEQQFTNPSSAEPTSDAALAAAASTTTKYTDIYANIIKNLTDRQARLEEMRKRIATIQERIDGESQTSTSKNQKLIIQ